MSGTVISHNFYENLFATSLDAVSRTFSKVDNDSEVVDILKNRSTEGLTPSQSAALLASLRDKNSNTRELIISASSALRKHLYANKVATMVPIEISSFCSSNCTFCGWRSSNKDMIRLSITNEALIDQVTYLGKLGFSHFELSAGDDLNFIRDSLPETVSILKKAALNANPDARISICLTPMHHLQYQNLKDRGLDTVLTWQETYDKNKYLSVVKNGPKAFGITSDFKVDKSGDGYLFRMKSHELAVQAGLQVGLGVMLGLSENAEADILSCISHARELLAKYPAMKPIIVGMPLWNTITTKATDNFNQRSVLIDPINDFELIASIYFLSLPDKKAWVFPNCRVPKDIQIKSIISAGSFTSTMVRVGPGAYLRPASGEIGKYFRRASVPLDNLNQALILSGEQFVHHYDEHEVYLEAFAKKGIEVVSENHLI